MSELVLPCQLIQSHLKNLMNVTIVDLLQHCVQQHPLSDTSEFQEKTATSSTTWRKIGSSETDQSKANSNIRRKKWTNVAERSYLLNSGYQNEPVARMTFAGSPAIKATKIGFTEVSTGMEQNYLLIYDNLTGTSNFVSFNVPRSKVIIITLVLLYPYQ